MKAAPMIFESLFFRSFAIETMGENQLAIHKNQKMSLSMQELCQLQRHLRALMMNPIFVWQALSVRIYRSPSRDSPVTELCQ